MYTFVVLLYLFILCDTHCTARTPLPFLFLPPSPSILSIGWGAEPKNPPLEERRDAHLFTTFALSTRATLIRK